MNIESKIREIKDFPNKGIIYRDVTTLLSDGEAFRSAIDQMQELLKDVEYDIVVGPESRGFIFGTPLAYAAKKGFVPVRKPGKLPYETISYEYELEYGTDVLEIHIDAIKPGQRVIIADDLLATGGTLHSTIKLIEQLGGEVVGICTLIELTYLNGRDKLKGYNVKSLIKY